MEQPRITVTAQQVKAHIDSVARKRNIPVYPPGTEAHVTMAKMLLTSHVTVGGLSQHYAPPDTSLPKGFPLALDGPMTWTGESILTKRAETILELSKKDLAEIDSAIAIFKCMKSGQNK